eukprot:gnl/TRDRNA2_/TRDRNA2_190997_c0_seq1.p1 gnl/TRDRNA2_/TRDRNA2_190997_c0~~gnl/TRDRNA2_/TRDRNA2_190997_c0_seq1.p1  ORF type:complete len:351 (+),score=43.65 gnl/TRDRNA2_/TRDRNA2_190997_c0_seq1:147-1055(+)
MAGTMLGKVWQLDFSSNRVETLAAFSDEGVRSLYLDDECGYATLCEGTRGWKRQGPRVQASMLCFRSLDRKNAQSVKHVLQRGPLACVLFPLCSIVVNVTRQEHYHCAFKLFDFGSSPTEVAPCDFDGSSLIVIDRSHVTFGPVFCLIRLEKNEHVEIDNLPKASKVTLVKLWGQDCIAYVAGGSDLYLYDYQKKQINHRLRGHRGEIVAVDASDTVTVATLGADSVVKLWNGLTGECNQTVFVPEASFFLGFPYCLHVCNGRILISADEGVYLMEPGPQEQTGAVGAGGGGGPPAYAVGST